MSNEIADEVAHWGLEEPAPFELTDLSTDEQTVWREFPADYRAMIETLNGGWLDESLWFDVPIVWENEGERREGKETRLEEIWTWRTLADDEHEEVTSVLHAHFARHVTDAFLPDGIFAIGRASQKSLIAISTRSDDSGAVFYREWYWNSPWYKSFFQARIRTALSVYEDAWAALEDPDHPNHELVVDAANYATLIKVADSWTEFVRALGPERAA